MTPDHPYYPTTLSLPHYVPNAYPLPTLLLIFLLLLSLLLTSVLTLTNLYRPHLTYSTRAQILWFTLCGTLHTLFESYFILNHVQLASLNTLPAQLWKEYALSDSRYLTSDPLVLALETVTVLVWGPLCFSAAWLTARESAWERVVQCVVCVGHLYGVVLYLVSGWFDGGEYSRPEGVYFWGYFVGLNAVWVVVPGWLLWEGCREWVRAVEERRLKKRM